MDGKTLQNCFVKMSNVKGIEDMMGASLISMHIDFLFTFRNLPVTPMADGIWIERVKTLRDSAFIIYLPFFSHYLFEFVI